MKQKVYYLIVDENPWFAQISANSKTSKAQSKWHRWPRWPRYKTITIIVSFVSRSFKHSMPMRTNRGRAAPTNDIGSGILDRRLVLSFPLSMKYLQRYHKMAKWRKRRLQNLITETWNRALPSMFQLRVFAKERLRDIANQTFRYWENKSKANYWQLQNKKTKIILDNNELIVQKLRIYFNSYLFSFESICFPKNLKDF